jgi:hypothetical protein
MTECIVTADVKDDEAQALARFLDRLMLSDFEAKCPSYTQEDAYLMQAAAEKVRRAIGQRQPVRSA